VCLVRWLVGAGNFGNYSGSTKTFRLAATAAPRVATPVRAMAGWLWSSVEQVRKEALAAEAALLDSVAWDGAS